MIRKVTPLIYAKGCMADAVYVGVANLLEIRFGGAGTGVSLEMEL